MLFLTDDKFMTSEFLPFVKIIVSKPNIGANSILFFSHQALNPLQVGIIHLVHM